MAEDYSEAGNAAAAAGFPILDPTTHKVKFGADEINITRDLIAEERQRVHWGTGNPSNSDGRPVGTIYCRLI